MAVSSRAWLRWLVVRCLQAGGAGVLALASAWLALSALARRRYLRLVVPGPEDSLLLGSLKEMGQLAKAGSGRDGQGRLHVFQRLKDKFGKVVKLRFGLDVYVVCFSEQAIAQCLKAGKPPSYERLSIIFGNGLLMQNGAKWKRHRGMLAHGFTASSLRSVVPFFYQGSATLCEVLCASQRREGEVDFSATVSLATLDIIARAGFGFELDALRGNNAELVAAFASILPLLLHPLGTVGKTPGTRLLKLINHKTFARIDAAIYPTIRDRVAGRTANTDGRRDLLDLLVEVRDESGKGLSVEEIRDECLLFFVAGFDTTSLTLQWALAQLAKHPRVWDKLIAELDSVCPDGRRVAFDDIKSLAYMDMVFSETLRLYPPAFAVTKAAPHDMVVEGVCIPHDTICMFPIAQYHRDPELWKHPNEFDPDLHFSPEATAKHQQWWPFLPFSFGDRVVRVTGLPLASAMVACEAHAGPAPTEHTRTHHRLAVWVGGRNQLTHPYSAVHRKPLLQRRGKDHLGRLAAHLHQSRAAQHGCAGCKSATTLVGVGTLFLCQQTLTWPDLTPRHPLRPQYTMASGTIHPVEHIRLRMTPRT